MASSNAGSLAPGGYQIMPRGSPPPGQHRRYYHAQGRLRQVFGITDDECMVAGPAGTGKSRCILEWLFYLTRKYPGCRGLIVRQTRESLTGSGLVTLEEHVFPRFANGQLPRWATNQQRRVRQSYMVPSGKNFAGLSEIVVGGLDNPVKYMSTEYDWIYVQEARETVQSAWEELTSRLGRNNRMPFSFIIGDTNPDGPSHWIMERSRRKALKLIESRHQDNPVFWDEEAGDWTESGRRYMARLNRLTGARLKRLRDGIWSGSENMVYDGWDPAVHVVSMADFRKRVKPRWPRDVLVDFGFTNAACVQWWAEDPDGRIYLYRELYGTRRLTRDWAHDIYEHSRGETIRRYITDHDKTERLELERHMGHGADECPDLTTDRKARAWSPPIVGTQPATKGATEMLGIQLVQARLNRQDDGFPRLFVVRGARVNPADELLSDQGAPTCTEEEFPRYEWARARSLTAGEVTLETPVQRWNHGLDLVRYLAIEMDGGLNPLAELYGKTVGESRTG